MDETTIHTPTPAEPEHQAPAAQPVQPAKGVNPILFWAVAVVLLGGAVGVYVLLNKDLGDTREKFNIALNNAIEAQKKKTDTLIEEEKAARAKEVTSLETENKTLSNQLVMVRKDYDTLSLNFKDVTGKHASEIAATREDLSGTKSDVHRIDVDVTYLKKNVGEINEKLELVKGDIGKLDNAHADLKREHAALVKEVADVTGSGKVTQVELEQLKTKTVQFELKVMSERAKQAAQALRENDHKKVMDLLDFVDKKETGGIIKTSNP
ncbi:MAG TPA: hypothetical protein VKX17_19100 [Planctomycetota bacterium]|nr:hypothetical protein [Planctomycetota bacterium]